VTGSTRAATPPRPRLGIQGPVLAFQDPWAGDASDAIMRTGTGITIQSQDPALTPTQFVGALDDLGAEFYVHHVIPGVDPQPMLDDLAAAGIDIVLGNEYGNINGPYVDGTNRYDLDPAHLRAAATAGILSAALYDEPEHLQIHADQYRKDGHLPHFGQTEGLDAEQSSTVIDATVRKIVGDVAEAAGAPVPVLAEQVFPVMFHTLARAGMTPTPKILKESFSPLQLGTALGAARQYSRDFWICVDLWGPDIGPWPTRAPGFPGHSPAEFASALRLAHFFAPSHLFVENIDILARHEGGGAMRDTEFGEVWREFVRDFVPRHPLTWSFHDARADIALIHAEDSDFGRGHKPFGNRGATAPATSRSVFEAWHALTHGATPRGGTSFHLPEFDFPRHRLNDVPRDRFPLAQGSDRPTRLHGLFQPSRSVLAFDAHVTDAVLGHPELLVVAGSRLPEATLALLRRRAERGADVVIPSWLAGAYGRSERRGGGVWAVYDDIADVADVLAPHLGEADRWTQRFGEVEVRISPADIDGATLSFEIIGA
jgi:hypothetical protein